MPECKYIFFSICWNHLISGTFKRLPEIAVNKCNKDQEKRLNFKPLPQGAVKFSCSSADNCHITNLVCKCWKHPIQRTMKASQEGKHHEQMKQRSRKTTKYHTLNSRSNKSRVLAVQLITAPQLTNRVRKYDSTTCRIHPISGTLKAS